MCPLHCRHILRSRYIKLGDFYIGAKSPGQSLEDLALNLLGRKSVLAAWQLPLVARFPQGTVVVPVLQDSSIAYV